MSIRGVAFHEQVLPPSSGELANAWRPVMETCIETFGANRCMFESNFPVDKGMCGYVSCWNAYKRIAAGCSADEKADLFAGSAARFYRLGDVGAERLTSDRLEATSWLASTGTADRADGTIRADELSARVGTQGERPWNSVISRCRRIRRSAA